MDHSDAQGVCFDAFTELEQALLTIIIGFAAIPIILTFLINQLWMRAAAAALGLTIALPTWLFFVHLARRLYEQDGYLRIDSALTAAGGAIPVTLTLFYFIGLYLTTPLITITGAVLLTTLAVLITYHHIGAPIYEQSFYAIENGWLFAYRTPEARDDAHTARPELSISGGHISFQPMIILLIVAVGLVLNTVFTSTTPSQQLIASILIGTVLLVPFTVMVIVTLAETKILGESIGEFAARLGTSYLYAFVGILMLMSVLIDGAGWAVIPPAAAVFCPFIALTTIIIYLYDPDLLIAPDAYENTSDPTTESPETDSPSPAELHRTANEAVTCDTETESETKPDSPHGKGDDDETETGIGMDESSVGDGESSSGIEQETDEDSSEATNGPDPEIADDRLSSEIDADSEDETGDRTGSETERDAEAHGDQTDPTADTDDTRNGED